MGDLSIVICLVAINISLLVISSSITHVLRDVVDELRRIQPTLRNK